MKQTKNIISDWLEKHGDPEIDKLVKQQAREIMAETNIEYQYLDLLQDILDNGVEKKDRTGTGTISVFGRQIRHKMSEGFPLLTTKKMAFKTMVTELLWFLKGDTNIKYLVDNDCNIWNGDAYKRYETEFKKGNAPGETLLVQRADGKSTEKKLSMDKFIAMIQHDDEFAKKWGDLGPVYGKQWRSWTKKKMYLSMDGSYEKIYDEMDQTVIDQISCLINDLKTNPDSRRLMVNAWNVGELDQMTLPPCHYGFQVYTRVLSYDEKVHEARKRFGFELEDGTRTFDINTKESIEFLTSTQRTISLMWNQRSVDTFLGLPFNIASYGLLLEIIAKEVNMVPDELIGNLGDVHLYKNHIEQAKEQIGREPFELPTLRMNPIFLANLEHKGLDVAVYGQADFQLENYQSHPTIKAPLSN